MRNIRINNNSITMPMQRLADGGGVYTNTPCPRCHVSGNFFADDPAVYGCLYHDGGSSLWNDRDNVFSNITSHIVFAHGDSKHTTVTRIWYNDSEAPNLQGDTNRDVRDANGKCINTSIVKLNASQPWPAPAAAIIANAGVRDDIPTPVAPPLSPPAPQWPPKGYKECNTPAPGPPRPPSGKFAAVACKPGKASQQWTLSQGVQPGDAKLTNVYMAAGSKGCWEIEACATGEGAAVNCNWGCKPLPKSCKSACDCNGAWNLNSNGTITSVMDGKCLQVAGGSAVNVGACTGKANQKFEWHAGVGNSTTYTVRQGALCVDQAAV